MSDQSTAAPLPPPQMIILPKSPPLSFPNYQLATTPSQHTFRADRLAGGLVGLQLAAPPPPPVSLRGIFDRTAVMPNFNPGGVGRGAGFIQPGLTSPLDRDSNATMAIRVRCALSVELRNGWLVL